MSVYRPNVITLLVPLAFFFTFYPFHIGFILHPHLSPSLPLSISLSLSLSHTHTHTQTLIYLSTSLVVHVIFFLVPHSSLLFFNASRSLPPCSLFLSLYLFPLFTSLLHRTFLVSQLPFIPLSSLLFTPTPPPFSPSFLYPSYPPPPRPPFPFISQYSFTHAFSLPL